jgi:hypothetical protein
MMSFAVRLVIAIFILVCCFIQLEASPTVAVLLAGTQKALEGRHDKSSMKQAFDSCKRLLDSILDAHHQKDSGTDETRLAFMQGAHAACVSARKSDISKYGRIMAQWQATYPADFLDESSKMRSEVPAA